MSNTLTDGAGFIWDINDDGSVNNGTSDAYDGAFDVTGFSPLAVNTLSGRYIISGTAVVDGLTITRRVYVSATEGWARFEDVITNTTGAAITTTHDLFSNLGSDGATQVIDSASGDAALTTGDAWLITDDTPATGSGDPRLGFVFRGNTFGSTVGTATISGDSLSVSYPITVAAGDTKVIVYFGAQSNDAAGLESLLASISGNVNPFLVDMPSDLKQEIINFSAAKVTVVSSVTRTLVVGEDNLTLIGTSPIDGTGNNFDNVIRGNSAANTLNGLGGNDQLFGNAGDDILNGGSGNDLLDGGLNSDDMFGGAGNDTYIVERTTDFVSEAGGNGTDLVKSSVNFTLGTGLENLTLTGSAVVGNGNTGNNVLVGNGAANTLNGLNGNDDLDGAGGVDTMSGGGGNDTYRVNVSTDRVIEGVNAGSDSVISSVTYTLGTNVENLTLTGTANLNGTGNSLNNRIAGNSGVNSLTGLAGNDTLIGGGGNDILDGGAGSNVLIGGTGNDKYIFTGTGGPTRIEDELGTDTMDFSRATTFANVDLRSGATSRCGTDIITLNIGSRISNDLDLVFLQDLSGSFGDDIATVRTLVPSIVNSVKAVAPLARFGYSTFVDKPTNPFGSTSDYVYLTNLPLTNSLSAVQSTVNGLSIFSGNDSPEAQIEALLQVAVRQSEVGFRSDSVRVVVLFTDADYHEAGDFTGVPANDGDAILDGTIPGLGEDYPSVTQLKSALIRAGIVPVFAVTDGATTTYDGLVSQLGFGAVVELTTNSSNIVSAIRTGLGEVTRASIENVIGTRFGDSLLGSDGDNQLSGGAGNDRIDGNLGNDTLRGEAGNDTFVFSKALNATTNRDVIADFVAVNDVIHLENTGAGVFNLLPNGALNPNAFKANAAGIANEADDRIIYSTATGALFYDSNGNAAGGAVQFATLSTRPVISAADFFVI